MVKENIVRDELTEEIMANTQDTFRLKKLRNELPKHSMYIRTRELYMEEVEKQIGENWELNNALVDAYADNEQSLA